MCIVSCSVLTRLHLLEMSAAATFQEMVNKTAIQMTRGKGNQEARLPSPPRGLCLVGYQRGFGKRAPLSSHKANAHLG